MSHVALVHGMIDCVGGAFRALDGSAVSLTGRELDLVAWLVARPGRVVSWEELERDVWGHRPGVVSRAPYFAWRRLVRKLEPEPEAPVHWLTHHGEGVSFVPVGGERPSPAAPPRTTNLGVDGTSLVGRSTEIGLVIGAFARGARWVELTGPVGVGKSRVARAAAEGVAARERWWCPLGDVAAGGVAAAIAATVGVSGDEAALRRALDARDALLVLDGADAHAAEVAALLDALCDETRTARVLVTTRVATRRPRAHRIPLDPLPDEDAALLFADRARQVAPEAPLPPGAVRAVVARLGGLPLAIELAAGRLSVLSVEALAARLDDPLALLRRPGDTGPHGSLAAAIAPSWAALPPEARAAAITLSAFAGSASLAAAEALLGPDALDLLERLCDASFLRPHRGPSGVRFAAPPGVGAFVASSGGDGARDAAFAAHRDRMGREARALWALSQAGDPAGRQGITDERSNFEAVVRRFPGTEAADACLLALAGFPPIAPDVQAALDEALARAGDHAGLRHARLTLRLRAGRLDAASEDAAEALARAATPADAALARMDAASVDRTRGAPAAALAHLDAIPEGVLPRLQHLQAFATRANVLVDLGRPREAHAVALRHLAEAEAAGSPIAVIAARTNLALSEIALGRGRRVIPVLEALQGALAPLDPFGEATLALLLGTARLQADDPAGATEAFGAARALHAAQGATGRVAQADGNLGLALRALGRWAEADARFRAALDGHRATANERGALLALLNLAIDALVTGDPAAAERALDEAAPLATDPANRVRWRCLRAIWAARTGDPDDAERLLADLGGLEGELDALLGTARDFVAVARGRAPGAEIGSFSAVRLLRLLL